MRADSAEKGGQNITPVLESHRQKSLASVLGVRV